MEQIYTKDEKTSVTSGKVMLSLLILIVHFGDDVEDQKPIVWMSRTFLPPANEVWGKVVFLHLSVSHSVHGGCTPS